jgi:hypothetical protein
MMKRGAMMAAVAAGALFAGAAPAAPTPTVLHISSHLPKAAKASLDDRPAVAAPGYGSTNVPALAGHHVLKIITAAGVTYRAELDLDPAKLMMWKGRGYWCVNLLERSLEVYSKDDCQEEVTDAG